MNRERIYEMRWVEIKVLLNNDLEEADFTILVQDFISKHPEFDKDAIIQLIKTDRDFVLSKDDSRIYSRFFILEDLRLKYYRLLSKITLNKSQNERELQSLIFPYNLKPEDVSNILFQIYSDVLTCFFKKM